MNDEAWMNIDGADVTLRLTSAARSARPPRRRTAPASSPATLTWKVTSVCGPDQPERESIGLDAAIEVARGGRVTKLDASGGC